MKRASGPGTKIIGGTRRGTKILGPPDESIRPLLSRVRGAIVDSLGKTIQRAAVLDLFAGTGSFGLEALSRGAAHTTFVEASETALEILRTNVERLEFTRYVEIVAGDAHDLAIPESIDWPFDLAFLDPPYRDVEIETGLLERPEDEGPGPERTLARLLERIVARLAPEARVVVHVPHRVGPEAFDPPGLDLLDHRVYGRSGILTYAPGPAG